MQKIKNYITIAVVLVNASLFLAPMASADTKSDIQGGVNAAAGQSNTTPGSINTTISEIVNILSAVVGIVAVIMLIVGGFRYITSGGSSEKVSSAKNTILYAIIGLVIVALAQAIVRFVLNKVA